MDTTSTFQYPPELMNILISAIPLLCRSKKDVLLFFRGAGINNNVYNDLLQKVNYKPESISKYEITRIILARINENGDKSLRERREVLKRIVEFEDFSCCWPNDILKAKGAVVEIRKIVNVKDSFSKMKIEVEKERQKHIDEQKAKLFEVEEKTKMLDQVKNSLFSLFSERNPQVKGKKLESVLNNLFKVSDILVREAFTLKGENKEGIIEQIDGVVEIDGNIYLVEMKWLKDNVDINEVSQHLVRLYHREASRGIFITATDFTPAALKTCKDALMRGVIVLCKLEEIVQLLEKRENLKQFFKMKINAAIIDKNPLYEPMKA